MKTEYEWTLEEIDEHGDIVDVQHCDTLEEIIRVRDRELNDNPAQRLDVGLVRDVWNGDGLVGRTWAYLTPDGKLPECFTTAFDRPATKVPQRFHREVADVGSRIAYHDKPRSTVETGLRKLVALL